MSESPLKGLLNSLMHRWARYVAPKVIRTRAEQELQLQEADAVAASVHAWRGAGPKHVVSLGQNCSTAWYLKQAGLKTRSFPFDWVATSPAIITHCISDRFATFLQRDLAVAKGVRAGHAVYNANFFGHRNPRTFPNDFDYYERCVGRFTRIMDSAEPVVMVTTVLNEPAKRPVWSEGFVNDYPLPEHQVAEDFQEMMDAFQQWNPNARFFFLEEYTEGPFNLEILYGNDRMLWVRNCVMGRSTGVHYLDPVDNEVALRVYSALKE